MKSRLSLAQLALLALFTVTAALAPACSGGGGGGGSGDDDDDDVLPTPARPGFVAMRLDTMLSIAVADGSDLVDIADAPNGPKAFVGFTEDDRMLYLAKTAALATAGDLYIVDVDGTNNTLLAPGVYNVDAWTDATHLLITRGPGPDISGSPQRDLFVVSLAGVETPIATSGEDESFAGQNAATIVFLRGNPIVDADFFAIPIVGGAETALTTDGGAKGFDGFTASGRLLYRSGVPSDVFAVDLTGGAADTLGSRANDEEVAAILGTRLIIRHRVPTMDAEESDLYAVDEDGTNEATIAATPDFPENVAGITESDLVIVLQQTSFDPPAFSVFSIAGDGTNKTDLADLTDGGILTIDGETLVYSSGGATNTNIYAIESDGSDERTLADAAGDDIFLDFANGHVLFRSGAPEKVWTVDVDGGNPEALRSGDEVGEQFNVALGPMVVMTVVGAGNKTDLVAANSSGGNLRTLAHDEDTETYRSITPDGRVIYTLNQGPFLDDVYIVNADGTDAINLTDRADEDVFLGFLP